MAVTHQPIFPQAPKKKSIAVTAANTARDGSGTINTVATIGVNGGKLKLLRSGIKQATAASNSQMVCHWYYSLDSGTTWYGLQELYLGNVSTGIAQISSYTEMDMGEKPMEPNALIGVAQTVYAGVQDKTHQSVEWYDY